MTLRDLFAIVLIFCLGTAGWWLLGLASEFRTYSTGMRLDRAVSQLWGSPIVQMAPGFSVTMPGTRQRRALPIDASTVDVDLQLEQRRKGLIWYPAFVVDFAAEYAVSNDTAVAQSVRVHLPLPSATATYDQFAIWLDGERREQAVDPARGVVDLMTLAAGATRTFKVRYRTRGLREWRYRLSEDGRVKQLALTVTTNFKAVDYPEGALSPMQVETMKQGLKLDWRADDLITRQDVAIRMPEKLNPGPLTARMSFFAPVCLVFFFVLVSSISILKQVPIHPMHYLFVTAGFFAFNALFAYLVDWIDVHLAFAVAGLVSVGLVVSYLRTALGPAFPWRLVAAGQLFYLVLFSYSFFLKGITGLIVTLGAVLTLALLMRLTARLDWRTVFVAKSSEAKVGVGN